MSLISRDEQVEMRDIFADFIAFGRQSSAYFLFQSGVKCYQSKNFSNGRVHYATQQTPLGALNIVFANPLCSVQNMSGLLEEFDAAQSIPSIYVSVSSEVADPLRKLGYHINQIGCESRVPLSDFHLHGRKKKQLRHASHFGERNGCVVRELNWDEVDGAQVKNISYQWLKSKEVKHRELQYATRPPAYCDEWGVRKFYCFQGNTMLAYVFFDPYYDDGELKGYCANILRSRASKACNGVIDFIILEATKQFQLEGVPELSLGVTPLHNVQQDPDERKSIRVISRLFHDYGNSLYSFKGLAYHKSRYRPVITPWYLCTKDISLFRLYWGMLFGLKVLGSREI